MRIGVIIIGTTGAFFYWMLSGFRGSFDSYFSSSKKTKNFITGLLLLYGLGTAIYLILKYWLHISLSDLQKPL